MGAVKVEYLLRTSEGPKLLQCPVSWYGVSTGLFENVIDKWRDDGTAESLMELFALLTELGYDNLMESNDETIEGKIYKAVSFVFDKGFSFQDLQIPNEFKFEDKLFMIPKNVGGLSIGQNLMLRKVFTKDEDLRKHISLAIAVYMQPILDGKKLDTDRVKYYQDKIKEMPITQTYALGIFFLNRLRVSGTQLSKCWHQTLKIIQSMKIVWLLPNLLRLNLLKPIKTLIMLKSML